jgi:ATP-dependent RNA helicase RhlE
VYNPLREEERLSAPQGERRPAPQGDRRPAPQGDRRPPRPQGEAGERKHFGGRGKPGGGYRGRARKTAG